MNRSPPQSDANATQLLLLESQELTVQIAPSEGGRIASIRSRRSGVEFLTQAHRPIAPTVPGMERPFSEGPCAGIEECLPTVGACEGCPDHGDFWQLPWTVSETHGRSRASLYADGFSHPLRFHKTLNVFDNQLRIDYRVQNTGEQPTSLLYACHPLFAIEQGDRILLPPEVQSCRLDYSRGNRGGPAGELLAWPRPETPIGIDLSTAQAATAHTAEMLYTDRLREGACGIYRTAAKQGIAMRFDTAQHPYLGIWLCFGGWPDLPGRPQQQAVALEPTNAPYNTLTAAQEGGLAKHLAPGESSAWTLSFHISKPEISLQDFTDFAFTS